MQEGHHVPSLPAWSFFRSRICQTCDLDGYVHDCGCDFRTVNLANQHFFYPVLQDLVSRSFFRYFKVRSRSEDGRHKATNTSYVSHWKTGQAT
jgi:hypothetical protein